MGKLCSLSRHTTFMLGGIVDLKCKRVKIAGQHLDLLFTGAEKILKFPCSSCKIVGSKPRRAFVKLVEGSVVSKFGIQTFVQFSYEIWSKFDSNSATSKCIEPGRAHVRRRVATCHVGLAAVPPGAHAGAGLRPLVRGRAP
jgi:hypothetical protein